MRGSRSQPRQFDRERVIYIDWVGAFDNVNDPVHCVIVVDLVIHERKELPCPLPVYGGGPQWAEFGVRRVDVRRAYGMPEPSKRICRDHYDASFCPGP